MRPQRDCGCSGGENGGPADDKAQAQRCVQYDSTTATWSGNVERRVHRDYFLVGRISKVSFLGRSGLGEGINSPSPPRIGALETTQITRLSNGEGTPQTVLYGGLVTISGKLGQTLILRSLVGVRFFAGEHGDFKGGTLCDVRKCGGCGSYWISCVSNHNWRACRYN